MALTWLGLGTNLGDRGENLAAAITMLREFGELEAVSSVYLTEPVGFRDQPDFWNMVARLRTALSPEALLEAVEEIEWALGRRPSFRNAPRTIDIDILLYDDSLINLPQLIIPHPGLLDRAFVLCPLVEIDPDLRYPGTGELLRDRLQQGDFERAEPIFPASVLLG